MERLDTVLGAITTPDFVLASLLQSSVKVCLRTSPSRHSPHEYCSPASRSCRHHVACFHISSSSPPTSILHFCRNHGAASQLLISHGWPLPEAFRSLLRQHTNPSRMISFFSSRGSKMGGLTADSAIALARSLGNGSKSI